jgi:hypothetical protein
MPNEQPIENRVYVPDDFLPQAWIVDVDGTVALLNGRKPFDWSAVDGDLPNHHVITVARLLAVPFDLIFLSGRSEVCRPATLAWLRRHVLALGITSEHLHMRAEGDFRPDATVKEEIFWRDIAPRWNVCGVLDDRDAVVAMWRRLGLTCLQVAPGDF